MAQKTKVKELVGRGLDSYHTKSLQQIDRIEKKNKEQNHKINILTNELDNDYLTKTEEGSVISLEHSKEGMIYIDELEGNTLVNYCSDGSKELTLNDEIDTEGINVILNNTIDNGIVDVSLEGNTMVNVCDQKEPVAITKSYTVENSGNHIALQGEYDGKCRPVIQGDTLVNYVTDGAKELTLNGDIDVEGTFVTTTEGVNNGKVEVMCEGNTEKVTNSNMICWLDSSNYVNGTISDNTKNNNYANVQGNIEYGDSGILADRISIPNITTLPTSFTIDIRTSLHELGTESIIAKRTSVSNGFFVFYYQGKLCYDFNGSENRCQTNVVLQPNILYRITFVVDNNKSKLYLDGNLIHEATHSFTYKDVEKSIDILYDSSNASYVREGKLVGLKVYNKALTKEEILLDEGYKLQSVGQDDENGHKIEILSRNKNLFVEDLINETGTGNSANGSLYPSMFNYSNTRCRTENPIKVKPNTTYYFSSNDKFHFAIAEFDKDNKQILENGWTIEPQGGIHTTSNNCVSIVVVIRKTDNSKITPQEIYGNIQIEEGILKTTYIEPKLNKKEILLNKPLRDLPNGLKDKFVKINNKWFIERNTDGYVMNTTENWRIRSSQTNTLTFDCSGLPLKSSKDFSNSHIFMKCTLFECRNYDTQDKEYIMLRANGDGFIIGINRSKLSTPDVDGFKKWLSENRVEVVYKLDTTTYEPLEIEPTLNTYNDITHISNNSIIPCNMKIKNTGYNAIIKPSTLYTVSLDTNKSGTIGMNLGGTEISTSNKITTITTPSTLVNNTLKLSGQGINVDKAMIFEGDLTQTPNLIPNGYIEGLKSSFEDQLVTDENDVNYRKYKVDYKVTGKNKFNKNKLYDKGYSINGNTVDRKGFDLNVKGIPNITISHKGSLHYGLFDAQDILIYNNHMDSSAISTRTIEIPSNCEVIKFGVLHKGFVTDTDLTTFQIEEGTVATSYEPYKEYTKTFYLNSPLLEGDTIEDVNGKATHVRRYGQVTLTGDEEIIKLMDNNYGFSIFNVISKGYSVKPNGNGFCNRLPYGDFSSDSIKNVQIVASSNQDNKFAIVVEKSTMDEFRNWLKSNHVTVVSELASPIYEPISTESILCDSYVNGHLDFDSAVPIEKVEFGYNTIALKYVQPSTKYTIQFESDGVGKVELLNIGGKTYPELNKDVVKGLNKTTVETIQSPTHNLLIMVGIGFNASNIQVVATDKEFEYFEGMKSVGECEDNKIEILSSNDVWHNKGFTRNCYIQGSDGNIIIENNQPQNCVTDFIQVKPNTTYTRNGLNSVCYSHVFFDENKNRVDNINATDYSKPFTFTTPSNCKYLRFKFYLPTTGNVDTIYLIEGTGTEKTSNKKEILINAPLRAVNNVKDKFVKMGNKLFIERNNIEIVCNGNENWIYSSPVFKLSVGKYPHKEEEGNGAMGWGICDRYSEIRNIIGSKDYTFKMQSQSIQIRNKDFTDVDSFKSHLNSNPIKVVYQLATPIYEPLEIEPVLNTYNDVTHISNNSIIPCNMKIKNTGYNAIIKPSTLYTVSLDTNKSGTIGMNLGGAKGTTTNNVLTITTPATLTDDSLRLFGKGIKGSKVRLLEGDKTNWIPSHFEGMKSSFEDKVQEDGSYKMEILSSNGNLFDKEYLSDKSNIINYSSYCTMKNPFKLKPNKKYTLWTPRIDAPPRYNNNTGGWTVTNIRTGLYTDGKAKDICNIFNINNKEGNHNGLNNVLRRFTSPSDGEIYWTCYDDNNGKAPQENWFTSLMKDVYLIEGDYVNYNELPQWVKDDYVGRIMNKIQFSSIEPLRGIGDAHDRLVFKDGKLIIERNCKEVVLDGSEDEIIINYTNGVKTHAFGIKNGIDDVHYMRICLSNNFIGYGSSLGSANEKDRENIVIGSSVAPFVIYINKNKLNENTVNGFRQWLQQNPTTVVYQLAEPTYEEIPFELQKIILEGYENGTLFFDTNIPPTSTVTYAGETPIVKSVKLNKTEVLNNTNDINDNIIPYLMDMDYRVVCLQLQSEEFNDGVAIARLFGGAYEMLQRDIQSRRYSIDEYKHRLDAYLDANKITEEEYNKLGDMLNE